MSSDVPRYYKIICDHCNIIWSEEWKYSNPIKLGIQFVCPKCFKHDGTRVEVIV